MGSATGAESGMTCRPAMLGPGRCLGGLSAEGREEEAGRGARDPRRVVVGNPACTIS